MDSDKRSHVVLLFVCAVASLAYSAPLYGDDGGYAGYASYVPQKPLNRGGVNSDDSIDTSAGSPEITRRPSKRQKDSPAYAPRPVPKKYDVLDYVPSRQHGYSHNKITEDDPASPYHRATLYGQSEGGFKVADAYQNPHVDSHSDSEHNYKDEDVSDPQPYRYGYDLEDDHGNKQHRYEASDGHGNVKGTYGFTDEHGIYRSVQYVADKDGFRASIKTNEPGIVNEDPADVHVEAEKSEYK